MRRVACPQCGRFNLRPPAALAMLCDGCGAFTSLDRGRFRLPAAAGPWAENSADRKLAQARFTELGGEIHGSSGASRAHQKALWQEYSGLTFFLMPHVVPRAYLELPVTRWIQASIAMSEIALGASPLTAEQRVMHELAQRIYQPGADPVAAAAALVPAAETFYRALHGHLRFRDAHKHPTPERLARDFVYLTVSHAPGSLGRATLARIMTEVLGEPAAAPGAPSAAARPDPWLERQLRLWRDASRRYTGGVERAGTALQIALQSFTARRQVPEPAEVMDFLRAAIPEAAADDLARTIDLARHWAADDRGFQALLDQLEGELASWVPAPAPEPEPESGPEPDEAWIRTTLAHWKLVGANYPAEQRAMALVSLMLHPFHTGSSVRPVAARALLEQLPAPLPGGELHEALHQHRQLFEGSPAITAFLDAVLDDLRR